MIGERSGPDGLACREQPVADLRSLGLQPGSYARHVASMPAFDPARTPSAGMGAFAEHIRTRTEARRSAHPSRPSRRSGLTRQPP